MSSTVPVAATMSAKPHTAAPQCPTGTDVIEVMVRSLAGGLTAEEIAVMRSEFSGGSAVNPFRRFICLSAPYRSSLYDLLETAHPEVFAAMDDPRSLREASSIMSGFLRSQLKTANIDVNEDVFSMLVLDFIGDQEFYFRKRQLKRKQKRVDPAQLQKRKRTSS